MPLRKGVSGLAPLNAGDTAQNPLAQGSREHRRMADDELPESNDAAFDLAHNSAWPEKNCLARETPPGYLANAPNAGGSTAFFLGSV